MDWLIATIFILLSSELGLPVSHQSGQGSATSPEPQQKTTFNEDAPEGASLLDPWGITGT